MKTVIVIPTYNEAKNIGPLLEAIFHFNKENLSVLVVDDNSPDGTAKKVEALQDTYPVTLIKREGKFGLGSAYRKGFEEALKMNAELIFEMDADFSHAPEDIPKMILAAQNGADLVVGSRKVEGGKILGWGPLRLLMSNGAMHFSRIILDLKTKDVTAGFRCFKANTLQSIPLQKIKSNGYAFQEEILFLVEKKNFQVTEVPVTFNDRTQGKSKLSKKDIVEFFLVMFKLKFTKRKDLL
ncbi:MAG: dolichyl-phosphate beta-D-mannosyltransferase [Candidatus Magasanikbacteria bacterium CG11_big_fil_rev_8_21_14_0_20_39_34]|uniref:Dolichyl-phosphate beta-D-mannosyltransferase n=1 Tax=Candidatus Magasanikbacteria bacterium CG11_big_fil_rev_8_21_14_0_20_39_34 TaxID=1974653 RepID=A0A2H0N5S5_9BACT|nr:MAG: dolichyl-phosphate beta-D-mannosyltransferase [Candidatus Magasanikbacteria bacterium CG11_big_fil_rev_8_21_14_0_20_39_34]